MAKTKPKTRSVAYWKTVAIILGGIASVSVCLNAVLFIELAENPIAYMWLFGAFVILAAFYMVAFCSYSPPDQDAKSTSENRDG